MSGRNSEDLHGSVGIVASLVFRAEFREWTRVAQAFGPEIVVAIGDHRKHLSTCRPASGQRLLIDPQFQSLLNAKLARSSALRYLEAAPEQDIQGQRHLRGFYCLAWPPNGIATAAFGELTRSGWLAMS